MTTFSELIDAFDPSRDFDVPPDWLQGRTVYGGLMAALALQAALRDHPGALPPLRSAQVAFIGPPAGPIRFRTQVLRQGKSVVSVAVDAIAGDALATRAAFVFARPRESAIAHDFGKRPPAGPADDYRAFTPAERGMAPAFTRHFEMRPVAGALPLSGAEHPELLLWTRHGDAASVDPIVALVALADLLPPAAMTCFTAPAPISSVTWSFDLTGVAPRGDWFLQRAFSRQAADGYSLQDMEIWDDAGRQVLWGRQSVAVFA